MPNIRKQIVGALDELGGEYVGKVGLHVTASDGRTATVTRQQIVNHFQNELGTLAIRRAATRAWLKAQAAAALGAEQVPTSAVTFDFDDGDGTPTVLEVG